MCSCKSGRNMGVASLKYALETPFTFIINVDHPFNLKFLRQCLPFGTGSVCHLSIVFGAYFNIYASKPHLPILKCHNGNFLYSVPCCLPFCHFHNFMVCLFSFFKIIPATFKKIIFMHYIKPIRIL
jgi:hypothetical protein